MKKRKEDGDSEKSHEKSQEIKEQGGVDATATMAAKIRRLIKLIDKETRVIAGVAVERNTKREIKEASANLRSLVSQITTNEAQEVLRMIGIGKQASAEQEVMDEASLKEELVKLSEENRRLREQLGEMVTSHGRRETQTCEVGVQASDIENEIRAEEIRRAIETGEEAAIDVLKEEWPTAAFKVTTGDDSDPLKCGVDLAFCELLDGEQDVVIGRIINRYSELEGSGMETVYEALSETHRIKKGGVECIKDRRVYKINLKSGVHAGEIEEEGNTIKNLSIWADAAKVEGSREIMFVAPKVYDVEHFRKLLEVACYSKGLKLRVFLRGGGKEVEGVKRRDSDEEAVIIRTDGKSYSDLLKEVKDGIANSGERIAVDNVRKTKAGDMIVIIKGNREEAMKTKEALKKATGAKMYTSVGRRKRVLHVLDLDKLVTKAEVEEGFKQRLGADQADCFRVLSMRPAFGESQNATVEVEESLAETLLMGPPMNIGWQRCRLRERVDVIRCFNCKEVGHKREECTGVSKIEECLRCGEKGHMVKECSEANEEFCFNCKEKGHRNSSMRCPAFKKLVNEARARASRGRARRW